jgi:serine/threonine protein kinase
LFYTTYCASRFSDGQNIYLKISKSISSQQEFNKYQKEINAQKNLNHPNIVKLYDSFWNGSQLVIVMELADGDDFSKYLVLQMPE